MLYQLMATTIYLRLTGEAILAYECYAMVFINQLKCARLGQGTF